MNRAFGQLAVFLLFMGDPGVRGLWRELAELQTGEKFRWDDELRRPHGLVIWPRCRYPAASESASRRGEYANIDAVGCEDYGGGRIAFVHEWSADQ